MMNRFIIATIIVGVSASAAFATQCRDNNGKFIKCPPVSSKVVHCKDKSGKYVKCSAPGAHPA